MAIDYSNSLGGAIGLSGQPRDYTALTLQNLKSQVPKPTKAVPDKFNEWIKVQPGRYHDFILPEVEDKTNEFLHEAYDWREKNQQATKLPLYLEKKHRELMDFARAKELETQNVYQSVKKGAELLGQPDSQDKYQFNQELDDALANKSGLSPRAHAAYVRKLLGGGTFQESALFKGKEQPFKILEHINKSVLPSVASMTETQQRAAPQDDGSVITTTVKTLGADKLNKQLDFDLTNEKLKKGVEKAFSEIDPASQKLYNNSASKWYKDNVISMLERNDIKIQATRPAIQSLRSIGSGLYTNNDFNYAFLKGNELDAEKAYNNITGALTGLPIALPEKDGFEAKFNSVTGHSGNKLVFTRNDKATENKQLTFSDDNGKLVEGVPLGIVEQKGNPFVVLSIPSQKFISKTVSDGQGGQVSINVPASYEEKLVPFKGNNQGKILVEFRGADEAIKKENPNWLQNNMNVSTPAPKTITPGAKTIDEKVVVEKDGKKFNLPKSQLDAAIKQGYKLSK